MKKIHCLIIILLISVLPVFSQNVNEERIVISTSYNNLLSNSTHTGILDLVLIEAFNRIGLNAEIVYSKTANSLADVNSGLADAEMNRVEGMEKNYPNLVRVDEPNMIMEFVAFSRSSFVVEGWESLRDLNVGIVKGWKILENNTVGFPKVVFVPSETELFRMLDKDRLDVALYSKLTGYDYIKKAGYLRISHLEPPLAKRPMYLYLNNSRAELADEVAAALREMKSDGTYQELVSKALQAND